MRYTARDGGQPLATAAAASAKAQLNSVALAESRTGLYRLFSARHDYPTNWAQFLNPAPGTDQTLTLEMPPERFPFLTNGLDLKVRSLDVVAVTSSGDAWTLAAEHAVWHGRRGAGERRHDARRPCVDDPAYPDRRPRPRAERIRRHSADLESQAQGELSGRLPLAHCSAD